MHLLVFKTTTPIVVIPVGETSAHCHAKPSSRTVFHLTALALKRKVSCLSTMKVQVVPKSVYLLQEPDLDADEEYGLIDNMIVI